MEKLTSDLAASLGLPQLPTGWYWDRFANQCERVSVGHVGPTSDYFCDRDSGVPFIRSQDVRPGRLMLETAAAVVPTFHAKLKKSQLRSGDVLIVRVGANRGDCCVVPEGVSELNCANIVFARPIERTGFFAYFFQSALGQQLLLSATTGSAQGVINTGSVAAMPVPVAPVSTQRRITGILSAYNDLIENCERRIRVLDEMARALYREWFVLFRYPGQEKTPLVESSLGRIPKGWAVRPVKDLATVIYGFPFKSALFSTDSSGRTPLIRIRDIPVGASSTYTNEVADQRYEIENGDILVGMDGDFHMTIWSNGRALQNQRVARFRPTAGWTSLQLLLALERPIQALNTAIVGTTVAHLGDMHIRDIQLVEPSAEVLARSRALFEPIELEIRTLQQKARNLRKTRDLLLPRLLSGQLSVEDAA